MKKVVACDLNETRKRMHKFSGKPRNPLIILEFFENFRTDLLKITLLINNIDLLEIVKKTRIFL